MFMHLTSPPRTAQQRAAPFGVPGVPARRARLAFACTFLGYTGFPAAAFASAASRLASGREEIDFKQGAQA
jgi:hypothetical protein